jgi:hypothetical protein
MSSTRQVQFVDCGDQNRPSASCVEGQASSSTRSRGSLNRNRVTDAGRIYVEAVLERYLWLPGTPTRTSRWDRQLAECLYERDVPLATIQSALLLGAARRAFRRESSSPLPSIRTLHYFLPIVDELLEQPVPVQYTEYLEKKLLPLADAKTEPARATRVGGHRDPSSRTDSGRESGRRHRP